MKTFIELCERATSTVYHYTSLDNAMKIVTQGRFALTPSSGTASDAAKQVKDKPYYLSLTRMKAGDYTRANARGSGAVFELNGDWLNDRYTTKPIDYWDSWWIKQNAAGDKERTREAEDRVMSKDMFIDLPKNPGDFIKSVHILNEPESDDRWRGFADSNTRRIAIWAKTHNIPVKLYTDRKAFLLQNPNKAAPIAQTATAQRPNPMFPDRIPRDYLKVWRELWFKQKYSDLSSEAKSKVGRLYSADAHIGLEADIHNDKSGGKRSIEKMMNVFRWSKSKNAKEFVEKMDAKWRDRRD